MNFIIFVVARTQKLKSEIIHILQSHYPSSGNMQVILLKFLMATTSRFFKYLWPQKLIYGGGGYRTSGLLLTLQRHYNYTIAALKICFKFSEWLYFFIIKNRALHCYTCACVTTLHLLMRLYTVLELHILPLSSLILSLIIIKLNRYMSVSSVQASLDIPAFCHCGATVTCDRWRNQGCGSHTSEWKLN